MTYLPNTVIVDNTQIEQVTHFDFSENMVVDTTDNQSKVTIKSKGLQSVDILENRFYSTPIESDLSEGRIDKGFIYAIPIVLAQGTYINRIGISLNRNEGNHQIRLGIYSNENNFPKNLLLDAGTVGTLHAGEKEIMIDFTAPGGFIWLTVGTSKNFIRPISFNNLRLNSLLGRTIVQSSSDVAFVRGNFNFNPFPATFPSPSYQSDKAPYIWIRKVT